MRRVISWAAVVITALVLQSTVFATLNLGGAKPELVYLAQFITTPSPLLPIVLVGSATILGELFWGLISFLLGQLTVGAGELVRTALLSGLYNAVLTPILFPVIRRVAESSRARRVFRW